MRDSSYGDFRVSPTGGALGAVVTGLDGRRPLTGDTVLQLKKALYDYHILLFKDQHFTDQQFADFGLHFGAPFVPPSDMGVLGYTPGEAPPLVVTVANTRDKSGKEEGYLGNSELLPHSDHQWTPYPSSGSMLYGIEVPTTGGDTEWVNLVAAYDDLDQATKDKIADLRMITYNPFDKGPQGETVVGYRASNGEERGAVYPHPVVRTHPDSGKKILYVNCAYLVEIVDVSQEEGRSIVEQLRKHLSQRKFFYTHKWSVGDVVYWDNQCTLHYRRSFDNAERRVLKRVSLAGSRPF